MNSAACPWQLGWIMSESVNHRLTRICGDYAGGALASAVLELSDWTRQTDCPPEARVMLASALVCQEKLSEALAVLHGGGNLADHQYPLDIGRMLVAVLTQADMTQSAQSVASHCFHRLGDQGDMIAWLEAVEAPGFGDLGHQPDVMLESMARELLAQFDIIPSLVKAQQVNPSEQDISLLRGSIIRLTPQVKEKPQKLVVAQALAQLALLAGDEDETRRWAYRGLGLDPFNATLALVLSQVRGDASIGPEPQEVLARVADAYPHYHDVQAAAVRCEHAAGRIPQARMRLEAWLQRSPDQPIALELAQELAA